MPICCGASGAHTLTFDPLCQAGAPDARTDPPGAGAVAPSDLANQYVLLLRQHSTSSQLHFHRLSFSFSCKDHFSWKWTGSFYVLFTIDWVFPFWNCQCCFSFFVFWSTLLLLSSLLLLMLYRYFALFQFMCACQCSGLYGSCSHQPLLLRICRNTLIKRHTSA